MNIEPAPLHILNEVISDIYSPIKSTLKFAKNRLLTSMEIGFQNYFTSRVEKYSKSKTLLSPTSRIPLEEFYVCPIIANNSETYTKETYFDLFDKHRVSMIFGMAGIGKSMFLRHMFLKYSEINRGVIPIVAELRDINFENDNLLEVAHSEFTDPTKPYPFEAFEQLFHHSKILFFLDGFDEVSPQNRKKAIKHIIAITKKYPKSRIVITSRPTDELKSWAEADEFYIQDFEIEQIKELTRRAPIDEKIKTDFINKVESTYLKTHEPFLKNPLLCSMMIMTFMKGGDIPNKLHLFYGKAFNTLFRQHDETKLMYARSFHSELEEDQFIKVWQAFCYLTYIQGSYNFESDAQIINYINEACEFCGIDVSSKNVLSDLHESICIIVRDGAEYSFLHRSFQEYGVAEFLANEELDNYSEIINHIASRRGDNVIFLTFCLNQNKLDEKYFLPELKKFKKHLRDFRLISKRFYMFYQEIGIELGDEKIILYLVIDKPRLKNSKKILIPNIYNFFSSLKRCYKMGNYVNERELIRKALILKYNITEENLNSKSMEWPILNFTRDECNELKITDYVNKMIQDIKNVEIQILKRITQREKMTKLIKRN